MIDIVKTTPCECCGKKVKQHYTIKFNDYKSVNICSECVKELYLTMIQIMIDIKKEVEHDEL